MKPSPSVSFSVFSFWVSLSLLSSVSLSDSLRADPLLLGCDLLQGGCPGWGRQSQSPPPPPTMFQAVPGMWQASTLGQIGQAVQSRTSTYSAHVASLCHPRGQSELLPMTRSARKHLCFWTPSTFLFSLCLSRGQGTQQPECQKAWGWGSVLDLLPPPPPSRPLASRPSVFPAVMPEAGMCPFFPPGRALLLEAVVNPETL